jgi:hypothetical protein
MGRRLYESAQLRRNRVNAPHRLLSLGERRTKDLVQVQLGPSGPIIGSAGAARLVPSLRSCRKIFLSP